MSRSKQKRTNRRRVQARQARDRWAIQELRRQWNEAGYPYDICPGCGVAVEKDSGCNELCCTNCQTAFDYQGQVSGLQHLEAFHPFAILLVTLAVIRGLAFILVTIGFFESVQVGSFYIALLLCAFLLALFITHDPAGFPRRV